jgi:hypothetical protein
MAHKSYPFYNLSGRVGKGCFAPATDDVLLVQYMLSEIGKDPLVSDTTPDTPLPVDGVYTPVLDDWIFWFQDQCQRHGLPVLADSRIDPMPLIGNEGFCTENLAGARYTIAHLNATFRRRYPKKHDYLEAQPEMATISVRLVKDDYAGKLS